VSQFDAGEQLLDGAAGVFEGGGVAEGTANEAQVDVLYRQIGQMKDQPLRRLWQGLSSHRLALVILDRATTRIA
jgi:hypothetical protein